MLPSDWLYSLQKQLSFYRRRLGTMVLLVILLLLSSSTLWPQQRLTVRMPGDSESLITSNTTDQEKPFYEKKISFQQKNKGLPFVSQNQKG